MNYIELVFSVSPKEPTTEIIITELAEYGFDSFVETDDGAKAYIPEHLYSKELLSGISILNENTAIKYTINQIPQQNWNSFWENNFNPIIIEDQCCIRASFHQQMPEVKYDIVINPKMSFGTGHHETTTLMIEEMLQMNFKDQSVLDMGSGTGVLAILASKMGASDVLAVDVDEWAYENAKENIVLNGIDKVDVMKGDASILHKKVFNTILANINKNILLKDIPIYISSLNKNGSLLLSGFFENDVEVLLAKCESLGLTFANKRLKNTWAQLHLKKNK